MVWRARLDRALSRYCRRPLDSLDETVLAALRAGAAQLLILRTPPHAAVSETVSAMKGHRGRGLVNAVLRKLAAGGEPDPGSAAPAERWSHPPGLVDRWVRRFGMDDALRLMEWNNGVPSIGACVETFPEGSESGRYLDDYRILERTGSSPAGTLKGRWYIQDEAAAVVGRACAALTCGGRVLEIGAAPGGKTHHLCSCASIVISMDRSPARMARWMENRLRLGWNGAFPVVGDGVRPPVGTLFELVLLDAPCTNTGVYRRRPDARWKWSPELLREMAGLQRGLLRSASELVAPAGVLVYSACSLEDEEGPDQVEYFEGEGNCSFRRIPLEVPGELARDGMISIFPPEHGMDGHFAAAWRKDR